MATKSKELALVPEKELALLAAEFPVEPGFNRVLLPRLGMFSQDQVEGKGKSMKVVSEAGTFFLDSETDETNKDGKKIWKKEEIGTEIEGIILFKRKQLRFYDGEKYTSSPVYDTDDQIIKLFKDKAEVDSGTPAELKSRPIYQGVSAKGKSISKLEDNRILYVLYEGEVYQMNLRGTSMYAYQKYERTVSPPTVLTSFSSEPKENGATEWNQMTFDAKRPITLDELQEVKKHLVEIKEAVATEQAFYAQKQKVEGGMEF